MIPLIRVALSALLTASASGMPENDTPADLSRVPALTMMANVLGAATACEEIPHDRLSAAAREVGMLATKKALSAEDTTSIERLLMASAAAGRNAIESGQTDCKAVEAAFGELEQVVMQTPV